jgi:hypothetical protein
VEPEQPESSIDPAFPPERRKQEAEATKAEAEARKTAYEASREALSLGILTLSVLAGMALIAAGMITAELWLTPFGVSLLLAGQARRGSR